MPRAGLIARAITIVASCSIASGCGAANRPEATTEAPALLVTEAEWRSTCDGPSRERLELHRQLAVREARASGETAQLDALLAWRPRTAAEAARPIDDDIVLAVATSVARRSLALCGEADVVRLTGELVRHQTIAAIAAPGQNAEHQRLATFLSEWAASQGLVFRISGDHDAWEIELPGATAGRALAYVFHADVVPVNDPPSLVALDAIPDGWTVPAFTTTLRDGRLYGRGTEDDKGPIAAAMTAIAALSDAGIAPRTGSIVLAIGTAEEDDWDGMRRYAAAAPHARHVVSVDSSYPVVVAESGFVSWGVRVPVTRLRASERRAVAIDARGGLFLTQIPDEAEVRVRPPRGEPIDAFALRVRALALEELAGRAEPAFRIDVETVDIESAPAVRIVARGRSSHSSTAEQGRNALWLLSGIASRLELAPGAVTTVLAIVRDVFDGDHHGDRLEIRYADDLMGELLVAPTVLRSETAEVRLEVNMRRPRGLSNEEFTARLDGALARLRARYGAAIQPVDDVYVGEAHVAELDGDLVPTLMQIWRTQTGDRDAQPISIRGGTYARLFPGAVDFGPSLPGRPYTGHGADEYVELEALRATTAMLYEAALRLTGIAE